MALRKTRVGKVLKPGDTEVTITGGNTMLTRWTNASHKISRAAILTMLAVGAIVLTNARQEAKAEGPRWHYEQACTMGPERPHLPFSIMNSRLDEFKARFEIILKHGKIAPEEKNASCTFVLESDGRISQLKSTARDHNPKAEPSLIEIVKRTAPTHLPDAIASHGWIIDMTLQDDHPSYKRSGYL